MADSDNTKLSVEEQVARIKAAKEAAKAAGAAAEAAKKAATGIVPPAPSTPAAPAPVAAVQAAPAAPVPVPVAPAAAAPVPAPVPAPGSVEEKVAQIKAAKAAAAANPTGKPATAVAVPPPPGAPTATGAGLTVEEKVAQIKAAKAAAAANPTGAPAAASPAKVPASTAAAATAAHSTVTPPIEPGTPAAAAMAAATHAKALGATGIDAKGTVANKPAVEHLAAAKPGVAKAAAPAKKKEPEGVLPLPPSIATPRRAFLGFITLGTFAWLVFFTWLAGVSHLFLRFMFPNVLYESDPKFAAGRKNDYPEAPKVYERFKQDQAVWLVRLTEEGQDRLVALSTVCTHLGCTPNWLETEQKYKCPCHGSGYYLNGVNFEGPTPRPLERFRIFIDGSGNIIVDKSKKFRQDLAQWNENQSYLIMG